MDTFFMSEFEIRAFGHVRIQTGSGPGLLIRVQVVRICRKIRVRTNSDNRSEPDYEVAKDGGLGLSLRKNRRPF